jgi:hypothetical protein
LNVKLEDSTHLLFLQYCFWLNPQASGFGLVTSVHLAPLSVGRGWSGPIPAYLKVLVVVSGLWGLQAWCRDDPSFLLGEEGLGRPGLFGFVLFFRLGS